MATVHYDLPQDPRFPTAPRGPATWQAPTEAAAAEARDQALAFRASAHEVMAHLVEAGPAPPA